MALSNLGKTVYTEKRYLMDLVNTNFVSLNIPNVSIFFDDLSKTEIINFLKKESFNKLIFLKKDYENFKKYLNKDTYPSHMDYLDSEVAPDLMRFMKSIIFGSKNRSYYSFLSKIGEENLPILKKDEIELIDNISELLPLVRPDEYLLIKNYLDNGAFDHIKIIDNIDNKRVSNESLKHAMYVLNKKNIINDNLLNVSEISKQLVDWLYDLCDYGLNRFEIEFGDYDAEEEFKLYGNYYKEQIMMEQREDSFNFIQGTKFNDDATILFVGLKKDGDKKEKMNYKDKFLSPKVFQWESENNTTIDNSTGKKLENTKKVHLFVRKMDREDGITLPFTYFGMGELKNRRESHVKAYSEKKGAYYAPTLLYDVVLDRRVKDEYFVETSYEKSSI